LDTKDKRTKIISPVRAWRKKGKKQKRRGPGVDASLPHYAYLLLLSLIPSFPHSLKKAVHIRLIRNQPPRPSDLLVSVSDGTMRSFSTLDGFCMESFHPARRFPTESMAAKMAERRRMSMVESPRSIKKHEPDACHLMQSSATAMDVGDFKFIIGVKADGLCFLFFLFFYSHLA
jgi:hypothetical protein